MLKKSGFGMRLMTWIALCISQSLAVGSNRFTVAALTGNTAIVGTLIVWSSTNLKSSVTIGGTLGLSGAALFASTLGVTGDTAMTAKLNVGGTFRVGRCTFKP